MLPSLSFCFGDLPASHIADNSVVDHVPRSRLLTVWQDRGVSIPLVVGASTQFELPGEGHELGTAS